MTAISNDHSAFARRYASAYLDAIDQANLESAAGEIKSFLKLIAENRDLRSVIENPLFSATDKRTILQAVAAKASLTKPLANFMLTVLDNGRIEHLPSILRAVLLQINKRQGAVDARIETAFPLNKEQEDKLAAEIGTLTGGKANMTVHVNPALIGGIVITLGSQRFDGSVKRRLELLAQQMRDGSNEASQDAAAPKSKKLKA